MSRHMGTGELVEKSKIPQWKGKPPGPGPFERTACGVLIPPGDVVKPEEVDCKSCQRTQLWRSAGVGRKPAPSGVAKRSTVAVVSEITVPDKVRSLLGAYKRLSLTAPVDDDFPEVLRSFDRQLVDVDITVPDAEMGADVLAWVRVCRQWRSRPSGTQEWIKLRDEVYKGYKDLKGATTD